jgi:hypothetical protein
VALRWFRFDTKIDFAHAMPLDQQPPVYSAAMGFAVVESNVGEAHRAG